MECFRKNLRTPRKFKKIIEFTLANIFTDCLGLGVYEFTVLGEFKGLKNEKKFVQLGSLKITMNKNQITKR